MTALKTTGALAVLALALALPTGAPAAKSARGSTCANPWQATYGKGKVRGDTGKVFLRVTTSGRRITVAWHAQPGYHFCTIMLVEGRGQIFRSVNPSASYTFTDFTNNQTNGIKTLSATARTGR
jgi:hypothetical protein